MISYCFRSEHGAHSSSINFPHCSLRFSLCLIGTPRVSQGCCMLRLPQLLNGLPCFWRWFLLTLESCLLWALSPLPRCCFSFLKLKSEALLLFEFKSGSVLGNCGIFKNRVQMTLNLKWQISQSVCQFTKIIIFQEFKEMCLLVGGGNVS